MLGGFHFFVASSLGASLTQSPIFGLSLGIISHHILDKLPHIDTNIFKRKFSSPKEWSFKIWIFVVFEFFLFLILDFYLISDLNLSIKKIAFWSGVGGILPDIVTLLYRTFHFNNKFLNYYENFHKSFHYRLKNNFILPLFTQILIFIIALALFLGLD